MRFRRNAQGERGMPFEWESVARILDETDVEVKGLGGTPKEPRGATRSHEEPLELG